MLGTGRGAWRWVWPAVALHAGGIAIDTAFHASAQRPFGLFEMAWAHGLSYVGAVVAILGGRGAARAVPSRGCRVAAWGIAALGVVQALTLAQDLLSELGGVDSAVGPVVYLLALGAMVTTAFFATRACGGGRRGRADVTFRRRRPSGE